MSISKGVKGAILMIAIQVVLVLALTGLLRLVLQGATVFSVPGKDLSFWIALVIVCFATSFVNAYTRSKMSDD
ncbi:protein of unknown function [Burkholderia multivorans]